MRRKCQLKFQEHDPIQQLLEVGQSMFWFTLLDAPDV